MKTRLPGIALLVVALAIAFAAPAFTSNESTCPW